MKKVSRRLGTNPVTKRRVLIALVVVTVVLGAGMRAVRLVERHAETETELEPERPLRDGVDATRPADALGTDPSSPVCTAETDTPPGSGRARVPTEQAPAHPTSRRRLYAVANAPTTARTTGGA